MGSFAYNNLRFLVVDDFGSFRSTMSDMLMSLGASQVLMAGDGNEAIETCRYKTFDVILCDYDLGDGQNGQRVLEALRHYKMIDRETLFVLVSADVSKRAVMAAYDCLPDDYLAKPINAQMLERRIGRLLVQREAMRPAFRALGRGDAQEAMAVLTRIALSDSKAAMAAQKFLGELFVEWGELAKAEKLYSKVLEAKPLDWARLGLAYVRQAQGSLEEAGEIFSGLTQENPLYLPAYDGMATNWDLRNDAIKLQGAIESSVQISPMSILRQQYLANIAEKNGDIPTALNALRQSIKLGRESCHGSWNDAYQFGAVVAAAPKEVLDNEKFLPQEALEILKEAALFFKVDDDRLLRGQFLRGRLQYMSQYEALGRECIEKAEAAYVCEVQNINTDVARVKALYTLGEDERADEVVHQLTQSYAYDQGALEQLDELLGEPVSEANKLLVAQINREGIGLYNDGLFDDAIDCFESARRLFPRHVGIQLNIVQALLGKLKEDGGDSAVQQAIEGGLLGLGVLVDEEHSQYARYQKLNKIFGVV